MLGQATIHLDQKEIHRAILQYLERHVLNKEWMEGVVIEKLEVEPYPSENRKPWRIELTKVPTLLGTPTP